MDPSSFRSGLAPEDETEIRARRSITRLWASQAHQDIIKDILDARHSEYTWSDSQIHASWLTFRNSKKRLALLLLARMVAIATTWEY